MTTPYNRLAGLGACIAFLTSCGGGDSSGSIRPAICERTASVSCGNLGATSESSASSTPAATPAPSSARPTSSDPAPVPNDVQGTSPISIQFGTGNTVIPFSATLYKKDYSILISDASGNPVSGVAVTVTAWPVAFRKGEYQWQPTTTSDPNQGAWVFARPIFTCANEDANRNGVLESNEDLNGNGRLEPGLPITVNAGGTTDAAGIVNISLVYPKDRANWTDVELTVRGSVAGTESVARNVVTLAALSEDFTKRLVSPPGSPSPYGIADCTSPL